MIEHAFAQPRKPKRVVLLGARGFIGTALRRRLEEDSVAILAPTSSELDLATPAAADRLAALLAPEDAVVMLAALTPDKGRDAGTLAKNFAMMQQLCKALEGSRCRHLVYFSSDAVYDPATSRVSEETPPSPRDLYGVMHFGREIMAAALKLPLLVLRPTLVYGAGDTHNAYGPNRFQRSAQQEGRIRLFGAGEEMRDHIHVDDVASLALACLTRQSTGTLNLATGTSRTFRDVAGVVAGRHSDAVRIEEAPRANPITHRHYDVTNLIRAFPGHRLLPLEQGLARYHSGVMEKAR